MGDKGIALEASPSTGLLPPWGHFVCTLTCSTGMCGAYADILHVQVGCVMIFSSARVNLTFCATAVLSISGIAYIAALLGDAHAACNLPQCVVPHIALQLHE